MRIISASLQNFASYKSLNFNFIDQGLTLIQGHTGSGKSTLCDAVPWTIWGQTAKGGAVSEVLTWPGDKVAKGSVHLEINNTAYIIRRSRGAKAKDNDLSIQEVGSDPRRGKDIPDTQKLINQLLGVTADLYLSGAYYHEFSQTAQFFTTTAKNRRAICEQLVDLTLAKTLQQRLAEHGSKLEKSASSLVSEQSKLESRLATLSEFETNHFKRKNAWDEEHQRRLSQLEKQLIDFENRPADVRSKNCPTCGAKTKHSHVVVTVNPYIEQMERQLAQQNPYSDQVKDCTADIAVCIAAITQVKQSIVAINTQLADVETLQDVTALYRSVAITNTIQDVETKTNQLLSDHFDAEIRVQFTVEDADKLDVLVYKDGNEAAYTQLSKGQRCLLKLCFGIAVMEAVANHHGIKFHQIMLDEALDGLSDEFKLKAFGLLQTVSQGYESVFLVEHSSELRERFINKYNVELVDGESIIERA